MKIIVCYNYFRIFAQAERRRREKDVSGILCRNMKGLTE
jgi:hypothetical protein